MLNSSYYIIIAALVVVVIVLIGINVKTLKRKAGEVAKQKQRRDAAQEARLNEQAQQSTLAVPQKTVLADTSTLNPQDLLSEANIYLEYGHNAQAAVVLRWYVDMVPTDMGSIQKLLGVYEAMSDIDAFVSLLHSIGMNVDSSVLQSDWWREQVCLGLKYDPGNLELVSLAAKSGISAPIPDESANMQDMTPEKVLAIVSHSNDIAYSLALLQKAILINPFKLSLYAEAMRITSQNNMLDKFVDFLLVLYLTVGYKSKALRERMLNAGKAIGPHLLWDPLEKWDGNSDMLVSLAKARGIKIPEDVINHLNKEEKD